MRCETRCNISLMILSILVLSPNLASATGEANDLWFLLSTHEDAKLTLEDLAEFLTENGYNAKPDGSYLTVALSQDEEEVYLTPNGLIPGLADMWQTRPENIPAEPVLVTCSYQKRCGDNIKKNITYKKTSNEKFVEDISKTVNFPIAENGWCSEGSRKAGQICRDLGYNVTYMFDPTERGHQWVLVEDGSTNTWLAVDSCYGIMDDIYYYSAYYSFPEIDDLELVNPHWRI
jgi:hypothetical protein